MKKSLGILSLICVFAACGGGGVKVVAGSPAYSVSKAEQQAVNIPPGHMPPPGQCRLWYPGEPPGHQPPPATCSELERTAPRGVWVLYRPSREKRVVRLR